MKRAALIFTEHKQLDVTTGWGYGKTAHYECVPTSEQLLADLRYVLDYALRQNITMADEGFEVYKRVRALLPEETQDE